MHKLEQCPRLQRLLCVGRRASRRPPCWRPRCHLHFSQTHSGTFPTDVGGIESSHPLDPDEKAASSDLAVSPAIVPAADDSVAVDLSSLFGQPARASQLRIGGGNHDKKLSTISA